MKSMQSSNKKSLSQKIFSARSLLIVYILLPLLIVGTGFSAWITYTPYVNMLVGSKITSDRVIDTSALMTIETFEPYTQQLYYTGPLDKDGKIVNELHIETAINLNLHNIFEVAKDCSQTQMYLSLTLSLKSGDNSTIFYDTEKQTSSFRYECSEKTFTKNGVSLLTATISNVHPTPTSSSVTMLVLLNFDDVSGSNPFALGELMAGDELLINPEFILNATGYETYFNLATKGTNFRLDVRLSETSPVA